MDRLSVRELRALALLRARGPLALHEISRALGVAPSTVHGMMLRLQAMDLVARIEDGEKRYVITEKGEEALRLVEQLLAGARG